MLTLVKFLHLFALMLGAAASFGGLIVALHAKRAGTPPPPALLAMRPFMAKLALGAIVLIWLTGLWLFFGWNPGAALSVIFHLKLLAAAALFLGIVVVNRQLAKAETSSTPPPAWLQTVARSNAALLVLAVALAVWVFN